MTGSISENQGRVLLRFARQILEHTLAGGAPAPGPGEDPVFDLMGWGLFISLHHGKRLRGCVGCLEGREPLGLLIPVYAGKVLKDPRFMSDPVTLMELPHLQIELSLLTPLKPLADYRHAVLGRHGIVIERDEMRGVFLPQVAGETGWDLETLWARCCDSKAGLRPDAYRDADSRLFVFETEVFSEGAA